MGAHGADADKSTFFLEPEVRDGTTRLSSGALQVSTPSVSFKPGQRPGDDRIDTELERACRNTDVPQTS